MATLPPGPRAPAIIQTFQYTASPTAFLERCRQRYGETFTMRVVGFGWGPVVVYSRPEHIREIFTLASEEADVAESNRMLRPLLGEHSLLLLEGERHARERRLLTPPFHGERMRAYGELIREVTDRALDALAVGKAFRFHDVSQQITLEVIMRAVFGIEEADQLEHLRKLLSKSADAAGKPFLLLPAFQFDWGKLSPWGRFLALRAEAEADVMARVERYRAAPDSARTDILSMLVAARDENGEAMSDDELRHEMRTLLMTGHETTASSLAWAVGWILERPDVVSAIREEIARVCGDGPIGADHVGQLKFLDATVMETMRLTPVTPTIGRALKVPKTIGGFELEPGTILAPAMHLTHRIAELYPEPETFDPSRFLDRKVNPYEYFPFGGGRRRCIGMAFAYYEMKIVLAQLLRRCDLRRSRPGKMKVARRGVTLTPAGGMPLVLDQRRAAA